MNFLQKLGIPSLGAAQKALNDALPPAMQQDVAHETAHVEKQEADLATQIGEGLAKWQREMLVGLLGENGEKIMEGFDKKDLNATLIVGKLPVRLVQHVGKASKHRHARIVYRMMWRKPESKREVPIGEFRVNIKADGSVLMEEIWSQGKDEGQNS